VPVAAPEPVGGGVALAVVVPVCVGVDETGGVLDGDAPRESVALAVVDGEPVPEPLGVPDGVSDALGVAAGAPESEPVAHADGIDVPLGAPVPDGVPYCAAAEEEDIARVKCDGGGVGRQGCLRRVCRCIQIKFFSCAREVMSPVEAAPARHSYSREKKKFDGKRARCRHRCVRTERGDNAVAVAAHLD
jgi:hypothetical protein